jgi:hypothetical protein
MYICVGKEILKESLKKILFYYCFLNARILIVTMLRYIYGYIYIYICVCKTAKKNIHAQMRLA